ncbi:MAG: YitT family protein [Prevotella sp.]|nr:YitT family protein [Prevotella sp.]
MITNPHQKKRRSLSELQDYLMIALAMLLGSIGWVVFLLPNNITTGGLPGIASILYWGLGIPVQISYFALNAILLAIALKVMGWRFCVKTIYAVVLFTLFTSIFEPMARNSGFLSDQPFMAAVVGAAFLGMTSGLGLYSGGSTGGSDLIAAMVNKYHDISLGRVILICDLIIITSSYVVLRNWEQVIYGYVVLFISAFCVDRFINSMRSSVQFFIISDKYEEIGHRITAEALRGCTVINGQGFYSGKEMKMLFVLARQNESARIFNIIDMVDPHAFVSQSAVIGVYGEGFDPFKKH